MPSVAIVLGCKHLRVELNPKMAAPDLSAECICARKGYESSYTFRVGDPANILVEQESFCDRAGIGAADRPMGRAKNDFLEQSRYSSWRQIAHLRLLHDWAFRQHVGAASAADIPPVVAKGGRAKVSIYLVITFVAVQERPALIKSGILERALSSATYMR